MAVLQEFGEFITEWRPVCKPGRAPWFACDLPQLLSACIHDLLIRV
jgi:hypothetical protein